MNVQEFGEILNRKTKESQPIQTHWCEVTEVDWQAKTMTVKGLSDGLEFFDVLLGLGSYYRKPTIGTRCIIGLVENKEAATILIDAESFEEAVFYSGESEFVIKKEGFIVKANRESLKTIINDQNKELGKLCDEIMKIVVAIGTSPNNPVIMKIKQALSVTNDNRFNQILVE